MSLPFQLMFACIFTGSVYFLVRSPAAAHQAQGLSPPSAQTSEPKSPLGQFTSLCARATAEDDQTSAWLMAD